MIADIYFEEVIQEMSECTPTRNVRCGQFSLILNPDGSPKSIRLLFPM